MFATENLGVSIKARVAPAIDAKNIPRIVFGQVNLYITLNFAMIDPLWDNDTSSDIILGSKSLYTAFSINNFEFLKCYDNWES